MRESKRSRKLTPKQKEAERKNIQKALAWLHTKPLNESGKLASIADAAVKFNVNSYSTLRRRVRGDHKDAHEAHQSQQLLSTIQEKVLLEWIKILSHQSQLLTRRTLRWTIQQITGRMVDPSNKWIQRFRKRHPDVKLSRTQGLDPKRAQAFNRGTVQHYFTVLEAIFNSSQIPWENVWNMDEKGCQRGGGRKHSPEKAFVPREKRTAYRQASANLELVTIVESVNAVGDSTQPGFIFSGTRFHREWMEVNDEIAVSTSPNGWTDDFLCTEWFEKCFIPQAQARNPSKKEIVLIFDGHGSHLTRRIWQLAIENNIHLICLPAHTTHKLQPLDVGVFGPLSKAYTKRCDEVLAETGEEIPIQDFVKEYMAARQHAFTPEIIQCAFKKSGLNPLNPDIFTDEDYAPSAVSSIHAHLPDSYPILETTDESDVEESEEADVEGEGMEEFVNVDQAIFGDDMDVDSDHEEPPTVNGNPLKEEEEIILPPMPILENRHRRLPANIQEPRTLEEYQIALTSACQEINDLHDKLDNALSHCAMARTALEKEKKRSNAKLKKKSATALSLGEARCITSGEGKVLFDQELQWKENKRKKEEEAKKRREMNRAEKERERRERGPTLTFSGSLTGKTKDDIMEILNAMGLSSTGSNGKTLKKDDLIEKIKQHLDENADLKENPRFTRLFPSRASRNREQLPLQVASAPPGPSSLTQR